MKVNILRIGEKMKQVIKLLTLVMILSVFSGLEVVAVSNGTLTEQGNRPTSTLSTAENENEEILENFLSDLEKLRELEQYQINIKWTNLDSKKKAGEITLIGDNETGDLAGEVNYYFSEYYPQKASFNFLTYQRYDIAYVQQFKLLQSLAFFKQPFFTYKFEEELAGLEDYYVQVQPADIQTVGLNRHPLEALLVLPDELKLASIDPALLEEEDSVYSLTVERLEIPRQFFGNESFFNLSYSYAYDLQTATTSKRNFVPLDNQSSHLINFNEEEAFLNFSVDISSDITESLLAPYPELNVRAAAPKFDKKMGLSSVGLMEKLTKVEIIYDSDLKQYAIALEGMIENVDFNLFSEGSAQLSTNHMRIEYEISPTEKGVPQLKDVKKMSSSEADYYLEQLLQDHN